MLKSIVYNQNNQKIGEIDLPEKIFGAAWNADLVHQVYVWQIAASRKPLAHVKERGEVRGGGRKPWRQKHTGRARHGSIRSPLWVGGGVTFGPRKEKIFAKKINLKMKIKALLSVLSKKFKDQEVRIIENLALIEAKTKKAAELFNHFFTKSQPSVLCVVAKDNKNFLRAGRNLPKVKTVKTNSLNLIDCLKHQYIFFEQKAVDELAAKYDKYQKI